MSFDYTYNTIYEFLPIEHTSTIKRVGGHIVFILSYQWMSLALWLVYYNMQGLVLDKTVDIFSPPGTCMALSSTVKASQHG